MSKALKSVRALPSDPSANDVLKIEYIEVNLNNSRKLITGVDSASIASEKTLQDTETIVDNMMHLQKVRAELAWLDSITRKS